MEKFVQSYVLSARTIFQLFYEEEKILSIRVNGESMSYRKPVFFTSDWHIGHANSIIFDERPFKNLDHMHKSLVTRFNACVPSDGVCYFLGDMGVTSSTLTFEVMNKLNGIKILVLGNHDKQHTAMYNSGFDVVVNGAVLYIAGERVTMSHCPLLGLYREDLSHIPEYKQVAGANWHGEHKNEAYTFSNEDQFHLHGHIHSTPHTNKTKPRILGKQFDVGVPANNYMPVSISAIEAFIAKHKKGNL